MIRYDPRSTTPMLVNKPVPWMVWGHTVPVWKEGRDVLPPWTGSKKMNMRQCLGTAVLI